MIQSAILTAVGFMFWSKGPHLQGKLTYFGLRIYLTIAYLCYVGVWECACLNVKITDDARVMTLILLGSN